MQPPSWHYEEAEQLLRDAAESDVVNEKSYHDSRVARAHVHAILATVQLEFSEIDFDSFYRPVETREATGDRL